VPDYQTDTTLPNPFTADDFARIEEAMRGVHVAKMLIARCERCDVPVAEAKADCLALETFFQAINKEFRGPQSTTLGPLT
jgi:hypothetical protein